MTVINIRGTSGAGKSTLARRVMDRYTNRVPMYEAGRRRPHHYILSGGPGPRALYVLGHYEIPCGGSDTVSNRDQKFAAMTEARNRGLDVLFEGVVDSDEVQRTVALGAHIILLTTPVEECLRRIGERRAAAGQDKPLNEKATRSRVPAIDRACVRLRQAGLAVDRLDCEAAYTRIIQLLEQA